MGHTYRVKEYTPIAYLWWVPNSVQTVRTLALDQNKLVGSVMIDLSKRFDSIDYSLLLAELKAYGIRGIELLWFTD